MDQLVAAVATALNVPSDMVLRSARARAKADGVEVEAVLRAWSGGGEPRAEDDASAAPAAPPEVTAAPPTGADQPAGGPPAESAAPDVEVLTSAAEEESPTEPPEATEPREPKWEPEDAAAAAGAIPRWLVAIFMIVPALAVLYALFLPNGPNCGDAGRLAVDPVTGEAVNCDGSPYGAEVVDFFAIGAEEYSACASCHGENGAGAGNFPAFVGGSLLATFPEGQCEAQVEWVRVGTAGWPEPTYGALAKPVGGSGAVMPAFGEVLDEQQLRSVVLYERVQFGGQTLEAALADCGLSGEGEGSGEAAAGE